MIIVFQALCSSCCNMKFLLPYMNNKEGRVCQICCNALLRGKLFACEQRYVVDRCIINYLLSSLIGHLYNTETLLKTDTYTVGLVPTSFLRSTSHYPPLRIKRERETGRRENLEIRLGLVPAFLCPFLSTLNKTDISQRWTLSANPNSVCLRES